MGEPVTCVPGLTFIHEFPSHVSIIPDYQVSSLTHILHITFNI